MKFTIKTKVFEGPLDLLLNLIEQRRLSINEISLAKVTDDYIEHIKQFDNISMADSAHFIFIASTLLLIKSRSLLPELSLTTEEQSDIHNLEIRLKIYNRIRDGSKHIALLFGKDMLFTPSQIPPMEVTFVPDSRFSIQASLQMLKDLINRLPKKEALPKAIIGKVISLEDMINTLTTRITKHLKMNFSEFTKEHKNNRINVVVSFLAMLELVRQGMMNVQQESIFGDISMETKEVGIPHY